MAAQIDGQKLVKVAEQIDRYVYDEALALFLVRSCEKYHKFATSDP